MSPIGAIQSRMDTLQGLIDSLSPGAPASGQVSAQSSSVNATTFNQALAAAQGVSGVGIPSSPSSITNADGSINPQALQLANVEAGTGLAAIKAALAYQGVPYQWGGSTTAGMDCSGLLQRAFADIGIQLPRVAADQGRVGTAVASMAQAEPGDLLVFDSGAHIGIYMGGNTMIHAPAPGEHVAVTSVYETPTAIRRSVPTGSVLPDSTAATSAQAMASGLNYGTSGAGSASANMALFAMAMGQHS